MCKKGGLVIQRHDKIKFELQDIASRALIPSEVHDEPQIYLGRSEDVEESVSSSIDKLLARIGFICAVTILLR